MDQNGNIQSLLAEMLTPTSGESSLFLNQEHIDNITWHDFSTYEYLLPPTYRTLETRSEISAALLEFYINEIDGYLSEFDGHDVSQVVQFLFDLLDALQQIYLNSLAGSLFEALDPTNQPATGIHHREDYRDTVGTAINLLMVSLAELGLLSNLFNMYFSHRQVRYGPNAEVNKRWLIYDYVQNETEKASIQLIPVENLALYTKSAQDGGWQIGDKVNLLLGFRYLSVAHGLFQTIQKSYNKWLDIQGKSPNRNLLRQAREKLNFTIGYDFDTFSKSTWNVGLRLVYRQEWRPLGTQRGEVVRTIPLGPGQVEKVSTKVVRRTRVAKTAESLKATETTSEVADSIKDSNEILDEAIREYGMHYEVSASASFGAFGFGASVEASGGEQEEVATKIASTNSFLTETMMQTAKKVRTETKVVVSTESESTFESQVTSEIRNPNDEIAVTYIYSKLQRQYEILTRLAEVNTVIFIAENIPARHEVTEKWVRDYDWIIAKSLLDDSYRDALSLLSQSVPQDGLPEDVLERLGFELNYQRDFRDKLAGTATSFSLNSVDLSEDVERGYRETHKEELERKRIREIYMRKRFRLLEHIRDNILHYCRAIWSHEDPSKRLLRYKKQKISIPIVWEFILDDVQTKDNRLTSNNELSISGHLEPVRDAPTRDITEIINPAGPIGYAGNYAVYYLKPDAKLALQFDGDIFDALSVLRNDYVDPNNPSELLDPALRFIQETEPIPEPIPDETKKEMVSIVPEIRSEFILSQGKIDAISDSLFKENYHEYLFRLEYSRRIVVDTNNLVLDLEAGKGSTLENFKRLHRYIDVKKAEEEHRQMKLENDRREKLLQIDKFGDPNIDNLTVLASNQLDSTLLPAIQNLIPEVRDDNKNNNDEGG